SQRGRHVLLRPSRSSALPVGCRTPSALSSSSRVSRLLTSLHRNKDRRPSFLVLSISGRYPPSQHAQGGRNMSNAAPQRERQSRDRSTKNAPHLSDQQIADRYMISRSTVWRWVASHGFPEPIKFSPGCTRWKLADVEAWEQGRGRSPQSTKMS